MPKIQIKITESSLGAFTIEIVGIVTFTIAFDVARRLFERLGKELPSSRRTMAAHCRDLWRSIKAGQCRPGVQTNLVGDWVACWTVTIRGKSKAIYPELIDFISFLPQSEQSEATRYFRSRGAQF